MKRVLAWLTPIFASPSYHKYDATDYYRIDSDFGTEDDLRALLDACHASLVFLASIFLKNSEILPQSTRRCQMPKTENP